MATYFIGDLHGCYDELQALLEKVDFDEKRDRLYFTGDLVARGENSLACLRFVKSLGEAAQTVLGNHDLHLLATAFGIKKPKAWDRLDALFAADDVDELIHWLRHQPLLIHLPEKNVVLTHAGISPDWDLPTARQCAAEIERELQQGDFRTLLENMYDNHPDRWSPDLQGVARWRYGINVLTRMRYCYADHRLDFDCKLPPEQAPQTLQPWFNLLHPQMKTVNLIFGHWASLLNTPTPAGVYALDSGCVWGNELTLLHWESQQFFRQPAMKKATSWQR